MMDKFEILGCPCMAVSELQAADHLKELLQSDQSGYTVAVNAEKILKYSDESGFSEIVDKSIFPYPDGSGAVLGLRWLHAERAEKINMPVIALEVANELGIPTFIVGAKADNHAKAIKNIRKKYTGIDLIGHFDGYQDQHILAHAIRCSQPKLILVAMGSPKQEKFAARVLGEVNAGIVVGCGGALDIMAGVLRRAPNFMINNHLEWLYRLYNEPWRIRRQLFLLRFLWRLSLSRTKKLFKTL